MGLVDISFVVSELPLCLFAISVKRQIAGDYSDKVWKRATETLSSKSTDELVLRAHLISWNDMCLCHISFSKV